MALSSQNARSDMGRRPYGGGRGRRKGRGPFGTRLIGLALLALIVFGAWWMWRPEASTAEVPAEGADQIDLRAGESSSPSTRTAGSQLIPEPTTQRASRTQTPTQPTQDESRAASVITMGQKLPEPATAGSTGAQLSSAEKSNSPIANPGRNNRTTTATRPARFEGELNALLEEANRSLASNRPIEARELFNRVLHDPRTDEMQRAVIRSRLTEINADLVFGPTIIPSDPHVTKYSVQSGDNLATIARRETQGVDWRFIQRVNRITDPGRLRVGQPLKVVRGPFHAVVDKTSFRLDLYVGPAPTVSGGKVVLSGADGETPVYVCSFDVGLGEYGSTPVGKWIVNDSRAMNPSWKNPRTGEYFAADDPMNPIGERWVGLDGLDPETELLTGYGLHGTIDPDSIGQERSMGCVRLGGADIEVVYEVLGPTVSIVEIVE